MKLFLKFCAIAMLILTACKSEKKEDSSKVDTEEIIEYVSFGDKITTEKALTAEEMLSKFKTLKAGDTITVKFASKIKEVCSKKGCWMKLPLNTNTETMVRFKNYGFFMPLDSKGKDVIIEGKAFVKKTSVKELRHYAEDAGKSKEEIDKITEPKTVFAFTANGALLK